MNFFDWEQAVSATHRKLPHWSQAEVSYFATFRLADSIPKPILAQWAERKELWLASHSDACSQEEQNEYYRLFTQKFHDYLDHGYGACLLANVENAQLVADALCHFDGQRYRLGAWVVMPNHVHVVFQTLDRWKPKQVLHSWKSFTASVINKRRGHDGQVWQHESYDHIIRSASELVRIEDYIQKNPEKAGVSVRYASWLS